MEVSQAYIMSPAEVFEELSVACLIYPCIGTASSLFQSLTLGIEKHCQRLRKPRQRKHTVGAIYQLKASQIILPGKPILGPGCDKKIWVKICFWRIMTDVINFARLENISFIFQLSLFINFY